MAHRTWPSAPTERADRCTVIDLVRRVGAERLRFTVADLRRVMQAEPRFRLTGSGDLSRHLAAIQPVTITSVGQPLAALCPEAGRRRPERTQHLYVLTERLPEHEATPPHLTDMVRVYLALWVAVEVADGAAVETNAVTRVCRAIEPLAVDERVQMCTRLMALADRTTPLVRRADAHAAPVHSRWRRWQPVGRRPNDPRFADWVAIVRALEDGVAAPRRVGHVTVHELVLEMVGIAIDRTCSSVWPQGRSVTVEDIAAACAEDPRARELDELLRQRGTSRGKVLGDATKARIAGRRRAAPRVVKVGATARATGGSHTYYDIPARAGFEARALVVALESVRAAVSHEIFDDLAREYKQAQRLAREATTPALAAVAAVRSFLVHREVAAIEQMVDGLMDQRHLLSAGAAAVLLRHTRTVAEARRHLGAETEDVRREAATRCAAVGVDFEAVVRTPRPLLLGDDFARWIPRARRAGRTGPQLLADATMLRRYANPEHTHRSDADPQRAAVYGVDRVDALVHLAEKLGARTLAFLQGGADLLGRDLRDASLVRAVLASAMGPAVADESGVVRDERLWARALAALALLGDEAAAREASAILAHPASGPDRIVRALHTLAVLRRIDVRTVPEAVHASADPAVIATLRSILTATRSEGWLL